MNAVPDIVHYTSGECSLGQVLYAVNAPGICAILIGDETAALVSDLARRFPEASLQRADVELAAELRNLLAHFDHPGSDLTLPRPLALSGTPFQKHVWQALTEVRRGETVSYRELAMRLGKPSATRAVAGACAANPVAVLVPCHRVLRSDGGISGYRWGVERKRQLIELERRLASAV